MCPSFSAMLIKMVMYVSIYKKKNFIICFPLNSKFQRMLQIINIDQICFYFLTLAVIKNIIHISSKQYSSALNGLVLLTQTMEYSEIISKLMSL